MKGAWKFLVVAGTLLSICLVVLLKKREGYVITLVQMSSEMDEDVDGMDGVILPNVALSEYEKKLLYYKSKIHHPEKELKRGVEECTVLMPTYKREKMLPQILGHYCNKLSPLNRIVLVWNDPDTPVPPFVSEIKEKCDKELRVVPMDKNKLTNRLLPENLEGIESDCVFFVDDDLITSYQDLAVGLELWQASRHRVVGFEGRTRTFSILKDGSYFYGIPKANTETRVRAVPGSYSIILPGYFMHKSYLEMYFDPVMVPPEYIDYVDENINCEDILFTMMTTRFVRDANLGRSAGVAIEPRKHIRCLRLKETKGLTGRPGHLAIRSGCLQKFSEHFGKDSLIRTQLVVKQSNDIHDLFVDFEPLKDSK